jgi:hypothetical protein
MFEFDDNVSKPMTVTVTNSSVDNRGVPKAMTASLKIDFIPNIGGLLAFLIPSPITLLAGETKAFNYNIRPQVGAGAEASLPGKIRITISGQFTPNQVFDFDGIVYRDVTQTLFNVTLS